MKKQYTASKTLASTTLSIHLTTRNASELRKSIEEVEGAIWEGNKDYYFRISKGKLFSWSGVIKNLVLKMTELGYERIKTVSLSYEQYCALHENS